MKEKGEVFYFDYYRGRGGEGVLGIFFATSMGLMLNLQVLVVCVCVLYSVCMYVPLFGIILLN